jgi:integrase
MGLAGGDNLDKPPGHISYQTYRVLGNMPWCFANIQEAVKRSFATACKKAGIEDFTFHDLRHTFINNRRIEGHDYFCIMAATGHKTMSVFKRYNTVSRDELQALVNGKSG